VATGYNTPGVRVRESSTPTSAPLLAGPSLVALIGAASGAQTATERILLTATDAILLSNTGIDTTSFVAKSMLTGNTLNKGNYVLVQASDPDNTITGDETYTIARVTQPSTAPTAAAGSGTGLTGTYVYAYSNLNANGETGLSASSNSLVITNKDVNLTGIAVGPTGTTGRNIYRMKTSTGGDNAFHLVGTISNNTGTTLTDTTADVVAQGDGVSTFGTATPKEGIAASDTVVVTYNFTDTKYYEPTVMDNLDRLYEKYGQPFDSSGNITSILSLAALLAFTNGASEVITVAALTDTDAEISKALVRLESDELSAIVVPVRGTAAAVSAGAAHAANAAGQGNYRMVITGRDGTGTSIAATALRSAAGALNSQSVVLVSPSNFQTENPMTGKPLNLGGQYMAAAVAGMMAARDLEVPLTRKSVAGFTAINDKRTATELIQDSSAGLMAVQDRGGILQVRHGVTTAVGDTRTREASVVRAKYGMATRLRRALETYIGTVSTPLGAVALITGATIGVLNTIVLEGSISDYQNVQARVLESDPTVVEVRFSYTPAWPINNIEVIFTVNTSTGDFALGT
jgi:hypothetical protein